MFGDLLGLVAIIAIVALVVVVARQQQRLRVLEFDLDGLRKAFLAHRETVSATIAVPQAIPAGIAATPGEAAATDEQAPSVVEALQALPPEAAAREEVAAAAATAALQPAEIPATETVTPAAPAAETAKPAVPARPARPNVETALGTRWAVWVGGLALALGGIFLVRYTIEAGIFGPEVRLALAAVLGVALVAAGEVIRRFGFRSPVEGVSSAYVPGILTAAGAFVLFGTVYAAHAVYGFIDPSTAFVLLGVIGLATIAASLIHGQALAGIGVVGSYVTPALVSSNAPNLWALFGFIAIVLVAAGLIARFRSWPLLMGAAFAGAGLWTLFYMVAAFEPSDYTILTFITAVTLATLAVVWLARRDGETRFDGPSVVPALFVALTSLVLLLVVDESAANGVLYGVIYIVAMLAVAVWRAPAIALLHAAGAVVVLAFLRHAFSGAFSFDFLGEPVFLEGFYVAEVGKSELLRAGIALGVAFAAAGLWSARRFASVATVRAAMWAAWGVAAPLVVLLSLWITFGNLDRDTAYALVALALAVVFAAAGEAITRAEAQPLSGGPAASFAFTGAAIALVLALMMGFTPGWTTVLLGVAIALPAFATRFRAYPVLGWLSAGMAVFILLRFAIDPTIVGAQNLSTTPFLNWLLPGYGIPALGAAFAAWQLHRTTGGRPRLIMEAAATFFALIGAAMLVRHAMHGGVIDDSALTLSEQAIYTLIALAGSGILIALDQRSPSPVLRIGSMAVGVLSATMIVLLHFLALNPFFTDESTGTIPVFNLLLLAYLMPALAAGGLALFARRTRPRWYVAMLALLAALLAFAYATLSLRRLFHGEFIANWRDFSQVETYSYSALWLALGVALLVAGLLLKSQILRLASGALIVIAVAKVFLFDMSELEGVLRALSFIGLGVVLIGIGLFYQRMLRLGFGKEAEPESGAVAAPPP